ncbi:MAG: FtsX-like permease family protein [Bryobacteraceae bacterium]
MLRYLPLVFKNSLRNRRRSILTISSIAFSLCLLGLLFAMYRALFLAPPAPGQELRLVVRNKVSLTQSMPASYEARIRQVQGVKEASPWQWFGGTYKDNRDPKNFFARFGVDPKKFFGVHPEITIDPEVKQKFETERRACIVTTDLADKFGWKPGERIVLQGDIFPTNLELTLAGTFKAAGELETLYFNWDYVREGITSGRKDQIGAWQVLADSAESVPRISREIDAMFDNSPAQTKTESEQAFALSFVSFLGNVKVFLMSIVGAVTFTILLVSGNTMAMSVRERIREVGILKTLGYTPGAILTIILGEAAVISAIGGAIGIAMAQGMTAVIRQGPAFLQGLKTLSITPEVALLSLAVAISIGLISSIVPAWGAAKTPILDALRNAG